ncbi:MAG TPA: hypothetical protein DIW43_17890 [Spongiibacteraceae bacterium]|nr:hypothetical protein [Spongiibacteraceae bacterium]HCS29334.1 hypothetical protein [Spongiibacteraceae bacterium]
MDWQQVLAGSLKADSEQFGIQSPAVEWLGFPRLQAYGDSWVEAYWDIESRTLNSRGTIFGGYYGVLADGLLALATMTALQDNEHFVTSDLRISFFRAASTGRVRMRAEVTNRSRSLLHVEGDFRDESGQLLAKATAVQSIRIAE